MGGGNGREKKRFDKKKQYTNLIKCIEFEKFVAVHRFFFIIFFLILAK